MNELKCLNCGADQTNGLALCDRCQIAAAVILEFVPVYFRNLARWRPGRAGGRPVPGSRQPASLGAGSAGDHVSNVLDQAGNDISTWAQRLNDDRGVELPQQEDEATTVAALCRLFAEHLTSIATLDWGGDFIVAMGDTEQRLRRLTVRVAPGWYAGECGQCGHPTHVIPGLTWVTCGGCGATTYARDHLDTILSEARGWVARPRKVAEALVAMVDTELSVPRLYERIKKWEQREKIVGLRNLDSDGDETGPKRYRFGDVYDRVIADGPTSARAIVPQDVA